MGLRKLHVSKNRGTSFNIPDQPFKDTDDSNDGFFFIKPDPSDNELFWLGTMRGLWTYHIRTKVFTKMASDINNYLINNASVDFEGNILARVNDTHLTSMRKNSPGTWKHLLSANRPFKFTFDPECPESVYLVYDNIKNEPPEIWRSDDFGETFTRQAYLQEDYDPGESFWPNTTSIIASKVYEEGTLPVLFLANGGLWRSIDGGKTFDSIGGDLPSCLRDCHIYDIQVNKFGSQGRVYIHKDPGILTRDSVILKSTNPFADPVEWERVIPKALSQFDVVPGENDLFYLGAGNQGPYDSSSTSENLWYCVTGVQYAISKQYAYDLPYYTTINALKADPVYPNRVFMSTNVGVFFAEKENDTLTLIDNQMPKGININSMVVNKDPHEIIISTTSNGIWRLPLSNTYWIPVAPFYEKDVSGSVSSIESSLMLNAYNPEDIPIDIQIWGMDNEGQVQDQHMMQLSAGGTSTYLMEQDQISLIRYDAPVDIPIIVLRQNEDQVATVNSQDIHKSEKLLTPHLALNRDSFFTGFSIKPITADQIYWFDSLGYQGFPIPGQQKDITTFELGELQGNLSNSMGFGYFTNINQTGFLAGTQSFGRWDGGHQASLLPLQDKLSTSMTFPHIALDMANFWTGIVILNPWKQEANVTVEFHDYLSVIGVQTFSLAAKSKQTILFDNIPGTPESSPALNPLPTGASWMTVESNLELSGLEIFGSAGSNGDFMEGLRSIQDNWRSAVAPYLHYGDNKWQGFVLLNKADTTTTINIKLNDREGNVLNAVSWFLFPNSKETILLRDKFPEINNYSNLGSIQVDVTDGGALMGFSLFGDVEQPRKLLGGYGFLPLKQ